MQTCTLSSRLMVLKLPVYCQCQAHCWYLGQWLSKGFLPSLPQDGTTVYTCTFGMWKTPWDYSKQQENFSGSELNSTCHLHDLKMWTWIYLPTFKSNQIRMQCACGYVYSKYSSQELNHGSPVIFPVLYFRIDVQWCMDSNWYTEDTLPSM